MQEEKIKKTLIKMRRIAGLSQTALAKKMGTTQEYVCRMEKAGAVSMEKIAQFAKGCGGSAKIVLHIGDVAMAVRLENTGIGNETEKRKGLGKVRGPRKNATAKEKTGKLAGRKGKRSTP